MKQNFKKNQYNVATYEARSVVDVTLNSEGIYTAKIFTNAEFRLNIKTDPSTL